MDRRWELDRLRVASAATAVLSYAAEQYWSRVNIYSADWRVANSRDSLTWWTVPAFAIVSGAMSLDSGKEQSIKKFCSKNTLRVCAGIILMGANSCVLFRAWLSARAARDLQAGQNCGRSLGYLWYCPHVRACGLYASEGRQAPETLYGCFALLVFVAAVDVFVLVRGGQGKERARSHLGVIDSGFRRICSVYRCVRGVSRCGR